ncbi:metallophosphoesterase [Pseudanabaena sp. PCC 6802]|uniref:metallophosphoesterase n=1 Tax=Pseudanabaena sp. PCC 6802 TaxID=118173 RepID=UPI00034D7992|nr:metallophosphoesterase [Pseudanabaena sp. PCC 6802]
MIQKYLSGSLSIERIAIPIPDLVPALRGIKIVQMSDFHFDGLRLSEGLLKKAIAKSNEVNPDLVVLTGDYVTDNPQPIYRLAQQLKSLRSRAGVYAVLGNHDLFQRGARDIITDALTQSGIRVLWNDVVYPLGEEIAIVGLPDYWAKQFEPKLVMDRIPIHIPRIVLSHNPDSAEDLQPWRVDLQLSGHTHGGQIVIPGIGPIVGKMQTIHRSLPKQVTRAFPFLRPGCHKVVDRWEWSEGLHKVGNNLLYINRGLGTYMPGRLFCPPEVTVITLTQT